MERSTTFVNISVDIWHLPGVGQPKSFLIVSGFPWHTARTLLSAFCIGGFTGPSHPICVLGPNFS